MDISVPFLNAGFSKEETSKIIYFWTNQKKNPFLKTDIENRLNELFDFFKNYSISKNKVIKAIVKEPRILFVKAESMEKAIGQYTMVLNTSLKNLMSAILKQPSLLNRDPAVIVLNALKSARQISVSSAEFIKMGLKYPSLLLLSPETVKQHTVGLRKKLLLNKTEFAKVFKKFPNILTRNPESIFKLLDDVSVGLNVPVEMVKKSFLKAPSLFSYTAENLISKVKDGEEALKLSLPKMTKVFLAAPVLFEVKNQTIVSNIQQVSEIFGVGPERIVESFLKLPTLFLCSPALIKEKYDFYKEMYLDDVFQFKNEEKKDLELLKDYILDDPRETIVNSIQSLELRRIYGVWLKEKTGSSSPKPVWKRPNKIVEDLKNVSDEFWQKNPVLAQKYLQLQKEK